MASLSGWVAASLILLAACVPLLYRGLQKRRATPESAPIRAHVLLGLATSLATFAHTGLIVPELGSEAAVGGGAIAFVFGAGAFLVMVAHAGLGLGLRNPKLRDRGGRRRRHATTAIVLAALVIAHVVLLVRAR